MRATHLVDDRGNPVALGRELGRGGEGAVFDIAGRPDAVAKIYLKPPNAQHTAKLTAMAGMASASLLKIAAWPTGTLHDSAGKVAGFTMPKVGGHQPIFKLYGPKPRLQEFPKADWRFLIHAAMNAARSFSAVHSTGLVIGDVNHGNLVVAQDATVRMIDCDSFQVTTAKQTWFCTVGVGTHQPPEMQGRDSYAGVVRTPNHDNFGLAVIVFQLLCMARHPFAGRSLGPGEPPSIEDAIAASRYAYSRDRSRTKMDVPPGSLPIEALTPELQNLFEEAFAPGAVSGGRPVADRWVSALGGLAADLKPCRTNGAHYFRKGLNACPWCAIETASGVTLFPVVFVPGAVGTTGMAALWQQVSAVVEPSALGPWPSLPVASAVPSPDAREAAKNGRGLKIAAWASVAAAMAVSLAFASPGVRALLVPSIGILAFLIFHHTRTKNVGPFRDRLMEVKRDWEALRASWVAPLSGPGVSEVRAGLSKLKTEYDTLPAERARRLQRLHEQRRAKQLEEHLDRFSLANAKIPGIGPTKAATLASHGIDTAGDIVSGKVLAVPGFGPAAVTKLLAWRRAHEATFSFDPNRGVSAPETAVLERDIAARRSKLEQEVSAGLARIKGLSAALHSRHQTLRSKQAELGPRYAQALADVALVPEGRALHVRLLSMSGMAVVVALASAPGAYRLPEFPVATVPTSTPHVPPSPALSSVVATPAPVVHPPQPTEQTLPSKSLPNVAAAIAPRSEGDRVTMKQAANIRSAANNTASIIRIAPQGAVLKVFTKSAGWLQVGETEPWGWVFSGLVEPTP